MAVSNVGVAVGKITAFRHRRLQAPVSTVGVNSYFYAGLPAPATLRWRIAASQHVTCLSVGIEAAKVPEYLVCIIPGGNMYTEEVSSR